MKLHFRARAFKHAMDKTGERVLVRLAGRTYKTRAVVQNVGKNFMRKYDDDELNRRDLGYNSARDKLMFLPFFPMWERYQDSIFVAYRNKVYEVLTDSVVYLGDDPLYIWAIMREIVEGDGTYYDPAIGREAENQ